MRFLAPLKGELAFAKQKTEGLQGNDPSTAYAVPLPLQGRLRGAALGSTWKGELSAKQTEGIDMSDFLLLRRCVLIPSVTS